VNGFSLRTWLLCCKLWSRAWLHDQWFILQIISTSDVCRWHDWTYNIHSFICLADKIFLSCYNLRNSNIGIFDAQHEVLPCKHCTFISVFEPRVTCSKWFRFWLGSSEACKLTAFHVIVLLLNSVFILIGSHCILLHLSPEWHNYFMTSEIRYCTSCFNKGKKQEGSRRIPLPTERKNSRFNFTSLGIWNWPYKYKYLVRVYALLSMPF
jgi:hypothetical protein